MKAKEITNTLLKGVLLIVLINIIGLSIAVIEYLIK
jgi:hypothetical protein